MGVFTWTKYTTCMVFISAIQSSQASDPSILVFDLFMHATEVCPSVRLQGQLLEMLGYESLWYCRAREATWGYYLLVWLASPLSPTDSWPFDFFSSNITSQCGSDAPCCSKSIPSLTKNLIHDIVLGQFGFCGTGSVSEVGLIYGGDMLIATSASSVKEDATHSTLTLSIHARRTRFARMPMYVSLGFHHISLNNAIHSAAHLRRFLAHLV